MKIAIYARESSDDRNKSPSITDQIERAKQWIKDHQHEFVGVYADEGFSGGDWNRPKWNQLIKDGRARKFSVVITWNQDRLARDTEQFLWFYRNLRERGVKVHSVTEGEIDMETLGGRVKHTTMAQAAEIFRVNTSEKVKGAYQYKRKKAENKNEKIKWGREQIPSEFRELAIKLKQENPIWGYRKIARALPEYELKNGKKRQPSYVWVAGILQGVKKTPPEKEAAVPSKKDGKNIVLENNPIV